MKRNLIMGGVIGIIIVSILGSLLIGYVLGKKNQCTFKAEYPVVEKKEADLPAANDTDVPSISPDVPSISGMLREIRENGELIIEMPILVSSLTKESDVKTETITALTGPDTDFIKTRYISSSSTSPSIEETKITLRDFQIGNHVTVTSKENIEGQKTIVAIRVRQAITSTEEPAGD